MKPMIPTHTLLLSWIIKRNNVLQAHFCKSDSSPFTRFHHPFAFVFKILIEAIGHYP